MLLMFRARLARGARESGSLPLTDRAIVIVELPILTRGLTMRRSLFVSFAATILSSSIAGAQRQPVVPQGMSASATLTPGIRHGDVIYTSGQLGLSREAPDSTIQGQTKKALENVKAVVEAAGSTM